MSPTGARRSLWRRLNSPLSDEAIQWLLGWGFLAFGAIGLEPMLAGQGIDVWYLLAWVVGVVNLGVLSTRKWIRGRVRSDSGE